MTSNITDSSAADLSLADIMNEYEVMRRGARIFVRNKGGWILCRADSEADAREKIAEAARVRFAHKTSANVADYFAAKLGEAPTDAGLANLPVASNCGADCAGAIDAARMLLEHCAAAGTVSASARKTIIETAENICVTYWYG